MTSDDVVASAWADGHPDELLSALIDDELSARDAARVREHLASCDECAAALDAATTSRQALRALPFLDTDVGDRVVARRHAAARAGAAFVVVAAVAVGLVGASTGVQHPEVVPDVVAMSEVHLAWSAGGVDAAGAAAAPMGTLHEVGRVPDSYPAPSGVLGTGVSLSRRAVLDASDLTVVRYRAGDGEPGAVSVFQQPGRLEWDRLPAGTLEDLGGRLTWASRARPTVLVAQVGDLVVTVVGDDPAATTATLQAMPAVRRAGFAERVHDACQRFVATFGLR